jgi:excinuclease ABC subunit C
MHRSLLKKRMRDIPTGPGVYQWLDTKGNVLYVGKAKNLRRRMRQYLGQNTQREGFRKRGLFEKMADLSITLTNTELEALTLETHLIRKLKPHYNIQLTKDTHYAFLKLTRHDDFPSLQVVHVKQADGATYFGPYSNPYAQRRMAEILRKLYRFRTCGMTLHVSRQQKLFGALKEGKIPLEIIARKKDRRLPCLDYHIEKCIGPCTGLIEPSAYQKEHLNEAQSFLEGNRAPVLSRLIKGLKQSDIEKKFEKAEELNFVLRYTDRMKKQCLFPIPGSKSCDAFGYRLYRRKLHIVLLQVRGGNIVNELSLCVEGINEMEGALSQFLARYYEDTGDVPDSVLLQEPLEEAKALEQWLSTRKGTPVEILIPGAGKEAELVGLAYRNVQQKLSLQNAKRSIEKGSTRN